ncbi:MAG TPA: hypothetical protein PLT33_05770 [Deltaproteobacteria bacterium]|jgi:hypothetical protein|nr:hypothetical protein [Deltaproteobacteria bacterium]OQC29358.1 MAG: hypothetical protein BWX71_00261 [Deltaproteobacteria bacterium ADurb.Bin072]HNQ85060.1 hypothetical protein [Deltaproteobacteria bacterium]HNS89168.1 hypothetical protein [Deltaproteobacteria bacterium]HOA45432.1 hypothetical protein [Deltaproteobacteria bacterium]
MTLAQVLGWTVAGVCAAALMNFLLKQISREYLKTITEKNADFTASYRAFMRFMVRNHRYFGIAAGLLFLVHAGVVVASGVTSLTGIAAGLLLLALTGLGLYGFYVRKNPRGVWIHMHRGTAFILALSVIIHVFFKAYVLL